MRRMVLLYIKRNWVKFKKSTFYQWHKDFLLDGDHSNFTALSLIAIASVFGHVFQSWLKVFLMIFLMYLAEFYIWTVKNAQDKDYIHTKPPWKK